MKISEVVAMFSEDTGTITDAYQVVKALSQRSFPEADIKQIMKEINVNWHDVMDPFKRPNKKIYKQKGVKNQNKSPYAKLEGETVDPNTMEFVREEEVTRIPLAFQKMICNKRVSFCLANPAVRTYSALQNTTELDIQSFKFAMERILRDNKITTHDREIARNIFTYTEVAEYWYTSDLQERTNRYGFDTNKKVKVAIYTRENGYKFFPLKDKDGDLVCFSMQYQSKENGKLVTYFQVFTDEEIAIYKRKGAYRWEPVNTPVEHELGKIPIVFGWQLQPEYRDVNQLISRLEKLLSNHGDVNDYHSAPKLLLTNADKITGVGSKGESGIVIQAKGDADAKYITWDNATASVKLEIENLLMQIYALTQTPNINFDNLKNFGAVSGVAIKLLFMDAHLAVKDKEGTLNDFFQRRHSIIGSILSLMEPKLESIADVIEVNTELVPYMVADDKERAEIAQIENGNQPTKSQEKTVYEAGGDEAELKKIHAETKERNMVSITEPTNL